MKSNFFMNFSPETLHLKDKEGNAAYLFAGPNLELPSTLIAELMIYLSNKLY